MKLAILHNPITNQRNLEKILLQCGFEVQILKKASELRDEHILFLAGNGSFGGYLGYLREANFIEAILSHSRAGAPLIGICAGMQVLSDGSDENKKEQGLGIFSGKFSSFNSPMATNLGKRNVNFLNSFCPNVSHEKFFFCHSFYLNQKTVSEANEDLAQSEFSNTVFPAIVKKQRTIGIQFHPELSGSIGKDLLLSLMGFLNDRR